MDALWDVKEVAKYLKRDKRWVYVRASKGLIPHRVVGGGYRFDPDEIKAWLQGQPSGMVHPKTQTKATTPDLNNTIDVNTGRSE